MILTCDCCHKSVNAEDGPQNAHIYYNWGSAIIDFSKMNAINSELKFETMCYYCSYFLWNTIQKAIAQRIEQESNL